MIATDLLKAMLLKDPSSRLTAAAALQHEWFSTVKTLPVNYENLIKFQAL